MVSNVRSIFFCRVLWLYFLMSAAGEPMTAQFSTSPSKLTTVIANTWAVGSSTYNFSPSFAPMISSKLIVLPTGKMLLAGRITKTGTPVLIGPYLSTASGIAVRLINPNGRTAGEFGSSSLLSLTFSDSSAYLFESEYDRGTVLSPKEELEYHMTRDAQGRIIVAGSLAHRRLTSSYPSGWPFNTTGYGFFVNRLESNGQLDATFQTSGQYASSVDSLDNNSNKTYKARGLGVQSNGNVVVGLLHGRPNTPPYSALTVMQLSDNSTVTSAFDNYMPFVDQTHMALTVRPNDKVVVAYSLKKPLFSEFKLVVQQRNADLSYDGTFGSISYSVLGNMDTVGFGQDSLVVYAAAAQPNGKLLVLGKIFNGSNFDVLLVRLNESGGRDASFGTNGVLRYDVYGGDDYMMKMTQQRDGKIVLAGWSDSSGVIDMTVVRISTDGSIDTAFSNEGIWRSGKEITAWNSYDISAGDVDIAPDGNLVVAGHIHTLPYAILSIIQNPSQFYFTDSLSPAQASVQPGAVDSLVLTLGREVTAQTGKNIRIYTASGSLIEQIPATDSKVQLGTYSSASYSGAYPGEHGRHTITIHPTSPLTAGSYYVTVDSGAFRNTDGFDFWGFSDETSWSFSVMIPDSVPGTALSFPGSGSNYVQVPYSAGLNPSDNFTAELWVRAEGGAGSYRSPLGSEQSAPSAQGYYFYAGNDNNWQAWVGTGEWNVLNSGTPVTLNAWTHLALTVGANTAKFYVNGVLKNTSGSISFAPNTYGPFRIGDIAESPGFVPFNGKVDEIRLWNVVRTQKQIRESMHRVETGDASGLAAYFQLNEGNGTTTVDAGGNFTGTVTGSPSWVPSTIPAGRGTSTTQEGFTSGAAAFGTFTMTMTDPFDNAVDLIGTEIGQGPNATAGISGTPLDDRYWVVNSFGAAGSFAANLNFTVPSSFTNNGAANASSYTLYHRDDNGEGTWAAVVSGATGLTNTSMTFNGVTGFSQFAIGTDDPLPVELVAFTATARGNNAELQWTTATEESNVGYEVERSSVNGSSRISQSPQWLRLGFVEGSGTSNTPRQYQFTDNNLKPGTYSYRLKQIDRHGTVSYSQEVEMSLGSVPKIFALDQNFPNPFNPSTRIGFTLHTSGITTLTIYDVIGKEVATLVHQHLEAGTYHEYTFDTRHRSGGIFFARLVSGGMSAVRKLVFLK